MVLEDRVDPRVGDREQAEERADDDERTEAFVREQVHGTARDVRAESPTAILLAVLHEQHEDGEAEEREEERHDEDRGPKPVGALLRMKYAINGPATAPAVSIARWTPNEVPNRDGSELSDMSESRGAVRTPFPTRSAARKIDAGQAALRGREQTRACTRPTFRSRGPPPPCTCRTGR